jgi:uncharacterized protein YlxW (UPF0749 family)
MRFRRRPVPSQAASQPPPSQPPPSQPPPSQPPPAEPPPVQPSAPETSWRRITRMASPRIGKANVLATLLTMALGFAIATQIQQNQSTGLSALRQDELVRVLDDLGQRSTRLDQQLRDLQAQRDALKSGADSAAAATTAAQRRLDQLSVLAGTVRAQGPGIRLTISDPSNKITSVTLLDTVQELRDAGAEVIQVGQVRLVASSSFGDNGTTVTADGTALARPFVFRAIGDGQTLTSAMNIPGGIVDTVKRNGGSATVEQPSTVVIDALHTATTPRYAQPVTDSAGAAPTK